MELPIRASFPTPVGLFRGLVARDLRTLLARFFCLIDHDQRPMFVIALGLSA